MTSPTHDKEWIIEDKIISMMALCDDEKRLWGMDTDLGHQDVMRKAIKNELDQIRRDAVEKMEFQHKYETAYCPKCLGEMTHLLDNKHRYFCGNCNKIYQFVHFTKRAKTLGEQK